MHEEEFTFRYSIEMYESLNPMNLRESAYANPIIDVREKKRERERKKEKAFVHVCDVQHKSD